MIKTKEIPSSEGYIMASMLLETITKYYEDPINQAKTDARRGLRCVKG